jgi:1,4-alpha-glucan branching enzyme
LTTPGRVFHPIVHGVRAPDDKTNHYFIVTTKKKESFEIVEPNAAAVLLVGDFTGWERDPIALKRQKDGWWKATVPLDPGPHQYRFLVDGQWRDDTQCSQRAPNPFGSQNCVRQVSP